MVRSPRALSLLLASWLMTAHAMAQQPVFQDPLLDHLVGKWLLRGTVAGQKTTQDVDAAWALEHQYLRIHEVSREQNKDGMPSYEAIVFIGWNQKPGEYACSWLDIYGGITPFSLGYGKRTQDEIPFLFKDKDNTFHTIFTYHPKDDSWFWRLDNEQNGTLSPYGRLTLTRVK